MKMRATRMHGYKQPLRLEEVTVPDIGPEEILVKVGGAGMCRTDFQLIDGYFDRGQLLAKAGKIKHTVTRVRFDDINDTLDAIARGETIGRAVIVYD